MDLPSYVRQRTDSTAAAVQNEAMQTLGAMGEESSGPGSPDAPGGRVARTPPGTAANAAAARALQQWRAVDASLAPIIGRIGVRVLYRRCLVAAAVRHPWLPATTLDEATADDWAMLHATMSLQSPVEAARACAELFTSFRDLLGSLIGPSLTDRLLRPATTLEPGGPAAQANLS